MAGQASGNAVNTHCRICGLELIAGLACYNENHGGFIHIACATTENDKATVSDHIDATANAIKNCDMRETESMANEILRNAENEAKHTKCSRCGDELCLGGCRDIDYAPGNKDSPASATYKGINIHAQPGQVQMTCTECGETFILENGTAHVCDTINATLKDRNSKYNPNPDRLFYDLKMWTAMERAIEPLLPDDLSDETRGAIKGLLLKTARAMESGMGGVYVKDTDDDHKGYNKVIAATVLGIPPEEVKE